MGLTAEEIKAGSRAKLKTNKVSTPEWAEAAVKNPHVYVRTVSALAISLMQRIRELPIFLKDENAAGVVGWCVSCVCDEEGARLFDESDCEWLANGDFAPVNRCCAAAQELNGSDKETAGNSPTTPTGDSPSN